MLRVYRDDNYRACRALVAEAWDFAAHLQPHSLADFVTQPYALGSLAGSNYGVVVEESGVVVGFLSGRAGSGRGPVGLVT